MLKNNAHSEPSTPEQERQDSIALKKRAADDARNDADWFASHVRHQDDKTGRPSSLGLVTELFCPKPEGAGNGSHDRPGGFLAFAAAGATSEELLGIFLAAQAEDLAAQSTRIYSDNNFWPAKYIKWMNEVL